MFDSKVRLSINSKPSMNSNLSGLNSANKLWYDDEIKINIYKVIIKQ
jgi:hypothetical protein